MWLRNREIKGCNLELVTFWEESTTAKLLRRHRGLFPKHCKLDLEEKQRKISRSFKPHFPNQTSHVWNTPNNRPWGPVDWLPCKLIGGCIKTRTMFQCCLANSTCMCLLFQIVPACLLPMLKPLPQDRIGPAKRTASGAIFFSRSKLALEAAVCPASAILALNLWPENVWKATAIGFAIQSHLKLSKIIENKWRLLIYIICPAITISVTLSLKSTVAGVWMQANQISRSGLQKKSVERLWPATFDGVQMGALGPSTRP